MDAKKKTVFFKKTLAGPIGFAAHLMHFYCVQSKHPIVCNEKLNICGWQHLALSKSVSCNILQ